MAIDLSTAASPQVAVSATTLETADFGERWAAWLAKGAAHDRAVRRKMTIAAPIVFVVAAVAIYALLGR
jgi:hypothetical protein